MKERSLKSHHSHGSELQISGIKFKQLSFSSSSSSSLCERATRLGLYRERQREKEEREPYLIEIGAMVVDFIIWGGELGVFVLHLFIDYD